MIEDKLEFIERDLSACANKLSPVAISGTIERAINFVPKIQDPEAKERVCLDIAQACFKLAHHDIEFVIDALEWLANSQITTVRDSALIKLIDVTNIVCCGTDSSRDVHGVRAAEIRCRLIPENRRSIELNVAVSQAETLAFRNPSNLKPSAQAAAAQAAAVVLAYGERDQRITGASALLHRIAEKEPAIVLSALANIYENTPKAGQEKLSMVYFTVEQQASEAGKIANSKLTDAVAEAAMTRHKNPFATIAA